MSAGKASSSSIGASTSNAAAPTLFDNKRQKFGTLRVGTAGWTKASWRGPFHPKGTTKSSSEAMLDALQQHFSVVEVNGTCHAMPTKETVAKWKRHCGPGFVMAAKMVKYVTRL